MAEAARAIGVRSGWAPPQVALLSDGRLHLQDGPIDLVIAAFGARPAVERAYRAAAARLDGLLATLSAELPELRRPALPDRCRLVDPVARRMQEAVAPYARTTFITPMAAVAGAVAEAVLQAMLEAAPLDRVSVNNGGDIALHLAAGQTFDVGLVDRPDRPSLFARARIASGDGIAGIATSGWRGRSFSLGIADAVTVFAAHAADADAAATVIANAVDIPNHPAIHRVPVRDLQPDSDLGNRLVTRDVPELSATDRCLALDAGLATAKHLLSSRLIRAAALHLQGETRIVGDALALLPEAIHA